MAITYVTNTNNAYNTAGSATGTGTLAKPSGLAANDIIVLSVYKENTATNTATGWTSIQITDHASGYRLETFWKRATGSESDLNNAVTWTGSAWQHAVVAAYRGCITSGSPLDGTPSSATGTTGTTPPQTAAVTGMTTGSNNSLVIATKAEYLGQTSTPPSGMTERMDYDGGVIADVVQATAGATGTKTFTDMTVSDAWMGQVFALLEASSTPTASVSDTTTLSENVSVTGAYAPAAFSDTATLSENLSVQGAYAPALFSDQATVTDEASGATADVSPATGAPLAVFLVEQQL